jgi:hypothetical protein
MAHRPAYVVRDANGQPFRTGKGWGLWRIRRQVPLEGEAPDLAAVGVGGLRRVGGLVLDRAGSSYRRPQNVHAEAVITINGRLPRLGSPIEPHLGNGPFTVCI